MSPNESEYQEAIRRLEAERLRLQEQEANLRGMGSPADEVTRATDPFHSFHLQLEGEVSTYERLKRGEFDEVRNLHGLGRLLVALRVASGMTQRQLAERLGLHETQVSRDERNEYHGVTVDRASRVLDALGVRLTGRVEEPPRSTSIS